MPEEPALDKATTTVEFMHAMKLPPALRFDVFSQLCLLSSTKVRRLHVTEIPDLLIQLQ